eukprot:m.196622 g.196622  ORF g.196622 m.196622 type:complete len:1323 (+) comp15701_c0_seq1:273-4241(+)
MSSIDKLLIQGVRSFSPDVHQVIEFRGAPLTLIVGPNGSGKTTIIEALKFITTGEHPAGGSGATFIHDPKVIGESEVKAKVKLRFKDVTGNYLVATRLMEVTQTAKTQRFKTLEGAIEMYDPETKERHTLSTRCAEMNAELISRLGVSPAVLSNVIFCHQEDSNWPLGTPKDLKDRFDDIFAATRYTKALETIRKFRKDQNHVCDLLKKDIAHLKEKKDKAHEIQANAKRTQGEIDRLEKRKEEIEKELQPLQEKLQEMGDSIEQINNLEISLAMLESTHDQVHAQHLQLQNDISEVLDENEESLNRKISNFVSDIPLKEETMRKVTRNVDEHRRVIKTLDAQLSELRMKHGALTNAKQEHEARIVKRDKFIQEFGTTYKLTGLSSAPFSAKRLQSFMTELQKIKHAADAEQQALESEHNEKNRKLQKRIDEHKADYTRCREGIKNQEGQIEGIELKRTELQTKLDGTIAPMEALEDLKITVEAKEEAFRHAKANEGRGTYEDEIKRISAQIVEKRKVLEDLTEIQLKMTAQVAVSTRVEHTKSRLKTESDRRDRVLKDKEADLKKLFGVIPSVTSIHVEHDRKLQALKQDRDKSTEAQMNVRHELSSKQSQIDMISEEIQKDEARLRTLDETIRSECPEGSVTIELEQAEIELKEAREQVADMSSLQKAFAMFKIKAEQNTHCPLCRRAFDDDGIFQSFINDLDKKAKKTNSAASHNERLDMTTKRTEKLRGMLSLESERNQLKDTEIPNKKLKRSSYQKELRALKQKANKLESDAAEAQELVTEAEQLGKTCENIFQLNRTSKELERELRLEEAKLVGVDSSKSLEDVQNEIADCNEAKNSFEKKIERLKDQLEVKRLATRSAEADLNNAKQNYLEAKVKSEQRVSMEASLTTLKHEYDQARKKISGLRKELNPIQTKLDEATAALQTEVQDFRKRQDTMTQKTRTLDKQISNITSYNHEIDKFIREGKHTAVEASLSEMKALEEKTQEKKLAMEDANKRVEELRVELESVKSQERLLKDNLNLRTQARELKRLKKDIAKKHEELKKSNAAKIGEDRTRLVQKRQKLEHDKNNFTGQQTALRGKLHELQKELRGRGSYANAEEEHRKTLIELKTTEMANSDLNKYALALERAVTDYHRLKMEEINVIIKELWQQTYQGRDIDNIEIVTEDENESKASKASKAKDVNARRTYRYRVVMIKGSNKLDMRGRCSAGQKVLASIIIRLALAETFCLSCGIFTLDEPTTNLDEQNIESLARALARIIETRREQSNFQMVVITHDEEFVEKLGRNGIADSYYRVFKDNVNGRMCSQIRKQQISDLA